MSETISNPGSSVGNQWVGFTERVSFDAETPQESTGGPEASAQHDREVGSQVLDSTLEESAVTEETEEAKSPTGLEASTKAPEGHRPVGEMERPEIAREYMNLLHDLSENFTSPEAVHSAVVVEDGAVRDRRGYSGDEAFIKNFYKRNGLELDETSNFDELRASGKNALAELHYKNADLDRAHTLGMVDAILSSEQNWMDAGEEYTKAQTALADASTKLEQLRADREAKGFFGRLSTTLNFLRQTNEINADITRAQEDLSRAESKSHSSNQSLTNLLEAAYSTDYHYGHHRLARQHENDQAYKAQINEDYNNKFFGADDPVRQGKVSRALELRKALDMD